MEQTTDEFVSDAVQPDSPVPVPAGEDAERELRRTRRAAQRRARAKVRRKERLKKLLTRGAAVLAAVAVIGGAARVSLSRARSSDSGDAQAAVVNAVVPPVEETAPAVFQPQESADTVLLTPGTLSSSYAVLIDVASSKILSEQNARVAISPASMTKIMTILVASEHVKNLDDTFPITIDITDFSYSHDCSAVGFSLGEEPTVRDLFYGTILPSGADAAVALADYVAGSQEAFVELMNEKLDELGLSASSHFTNCVGLYDQDHYTTVYDMAMILKAAYDDDLCRQVLSAHTYTTSKTAQHPEGISLSNWFLRRIEDKDSGGLTVECAKTGFVNQSGNCAASIASDADGNIYLCVTAMSNSSWHCIYDHAALYKTVSGAASDA